MRQIEDVLMCGCYLRIEQEINESWKGEILLRSGFQHHGT